MDKSMRRIGCGIGSGQQRGRRRLKTLRRPQCRISIKKTNGAVAE